MNEIIDFLNSIDRADLESAPIDVPTPTPALVMFTSGADNDIALGADALRYVMAHGHTISIPDHALRFAEKVAIISIRARDTAAPVLANVNRALDEIANSIRRRERIDQDANQYENCASACSADQQKPNEGPMAPLQPTPIVRPPSGQKVEIKF